MPLLERVSQLAALTDYAHEADLGQGRLVLLSGEAGVGKSSLVEALQTSLTPARWVWGACDGLFTPRPLAPLHDIAHALGGELERLCRAEAPRDQLFSAMLAQISDGTALTVCVVEDVHWADDATLDLLRFLGRRIRDVRAMIVVTYRDDALGVDDRLRKALGELATQRSTRRVTLPTLSREAVGELTAGTGLDPVEVFRLTAGNPFYLGEVLRHGLGELPDSARDAVLAPVAGLTAAARSVLEVFALIGLRVEPAFLTSLTHARPGVTDELLASGVLLGADDSLHFRHEIARLAVEQSIGVHRRGPIHQRILTGLLAAGCDDDARLAFHAEGAGNADRVLVHAPLAGASASRAAAHREAAAQFERALRFVSATDDRTTATLYDEWGRELRVLDRWHEANDACERAISLWRKLGDPVREGRTLTAYSNTLWRLCRGHESDRALEAAIAVLTPLGPSTELTAVLAGLAASKGEQGDGEAITLARQARELALGLGMSGTVCDTLNTEAWAIAGQGGDWVDQMAEALELALAEGEHVGAGRAYTNMYTIYRHELRFAEGEPYLQEGLAYCTEHEVATFSNCLAGESVGVMTQMGRWAEAESLAEEILTRVSSPLNRMVPATALGRLRARQGREGLWPFLDEATSAADGLDDPTYMRQTHLARAEAHLLEGDMTQAAHEVDLARAAAGRGSPMARSEVAAWAHRVGAPVPAVPDLIEPYASEVRGEWARAAQLWEELGCEYDAGLVRLHSGDEGALRSALLQFERLGATATERLARQRMRDIGVKSVPTGGRATTRAHPAGLTRRERDVLELICSGQTNEEISAQLFISVKTVDHHVSAVLAKLGVTSRKVAATEAARLGLVGASS